MKRVAILISGGGSNMLRLVDEMRAGVIDAQPVLVLSNKASAGGIAKADALGIPTRVLPHTDYTSREDFDAALHDELLAAKPDVICLAGFMRILTPEFTAKWEGRMINIHPSLLPLFRGLHTHRRAIEAGVAVHGCTVHGVTAELDDGPIYGQAVVPVTADDTPDTLADKVLVQEHRLYPAVLAKFCDDETPRVAMTGL
ncbi:phosphoribosylglycinamide formyltransferase-1 [Monaibacterium marinum]|uniref:Phosphoribosylglycinamide formyltransferase n=1 Tax=Pontivivens marinum TaxID=1690039 RepID=A0A2C9CTI9_9RHOB|nr:phosphoribosylglycinamide formyltransferase [Monaibacterium marinum]SOH94577.1 phosphoribosylglycinamide formyltransferase-1 [Monaibacterium marinum]